MKKAIIAIMDWFNDGLRRACGSMTPFSRFITVLIMCIIFGAINLYITVSAIYNIGKEDAMKELREIESQKIAPVVFPGSNDSINNYK